jgi:hypothetical protein
MSGATTLSGFFASIQNIFRVVSIIRFGNFWVQGSLYCLLSGSSSRLPDWQFTRVFHDPEKMLLLAEQSHPRIPALSFVSTRTSLTCVTVIRRDGKPGSLRAPRKAGANSRSPSNKNPPAGLRRSLARCCARTGSAPLELAVCLSNRIIRSHLGS